ncbi:MAG: 30S ribosomal protein S6 [Planctomycetes bacterium]|nr:30S ribosomal protein S6 [Planctomycetota bacterium]
MGRSIYRKAKETHLGQIYEGMIILDNDLVRADWRKAKATLTDTLVKYGAVIHTARRWDERALAYPIKGNQRATYFLLYFELPDGRSSELRRSLDLNVNVLRYLFLAVDEIPAEEAELASAEEANDFELEPPPEDGPRPSVFDELDAARESERERLRSDEDGSPKREETASKPAESQEEKSPEGDTPSEESPKAEEAATATTSTDSPQES